MSIKYNGKTFEQIGTELALELNKMTVPELQEFREEWLEAIQMMPPVAKNFCNSLVDVIISSKEGSEK